MISSASNSSKIRLITDTDELAGTAYFEFALGKYAEKHWQKGWVYLEEYGMLLLEPVFVKIIPNFGWYSINEFQISNFKLKTSRKSTGQRRFNRKLENQTI